MRQISCRCEFRRALMLPSGRRAPAFACLGAAWLAVASVVLAGESNHTPPGRPVPGHGLSQLLFPLTAENKDVPEDPTAMPSASSPSASTQPPTATKQTA